MPDEVEATLQGEGGKRVTITIAEFSTTGSDGTTADPADDPNKFVIDNDKYRLTITIAE